MDEESDPKVDFRHIDKYTIDFGIYCFNRIFFFIFMWFLSFSNAGAWENIVSSLSTSSFVLLYKVYRFGMKIAGSIFQNDIFQRIVSTT